MNQQQRIVLGDGPQQIAIKLAEGNPGALRVIMETVKQGADIDPDSAFGMYTGAIGLDAIGIYGPRIWLLYKDVCGGHVDRLMAVLRAHQLGIHSQSQILAAIDRAGRGEPHGLDVNAAIEAVRERLPRFKVVAIQETT